MRAGALGRSWMVVVGSCVAAGYEGVLIGIGVTEGAAI